MSTAHKELRKSYEHALDTLWYLFKTGREREQLLEDELTRIRVVCRQALSNGKSNEYISEIEGICDRGLDK